MDTSEGAWRHTVSATILCWLPWRGPGVIRSVLPHSTGYLGGGLASCDQCCHTLVAMPWRAPDIIRSVLPHSAGYLGGGLTSYGQCYHTLLATLEGAWRHTVSATTLCWLPWRGPDVIRSVLPHSAGYLGGGLTSYGQCYHTLLVTLEGPDVIRSVLPHSAGYLGGGLTSYGQCYRTLLAILKGA